MISQKEELRLFFFFFKMEFASYACPIMKENISEHKNGKL